ncbi:hypothetical protein BJ742DRAFT_808567 [Cladochytrium replicatum]|nr:hypothetical protein BJ742DRAFT_808567 [Cladochytrium replicatum]
MVAAVLMDGALQVQKSDQVAATSTVQVVRAQESDRTPTMHIHKMESDQTMILDEPLSSTTKFDKRGNFDEMRRALDAVEQGIVEKQKDYGPKRTKTEVQESGTRMIEVTNEAEKGPEKSMSVNHDTLIREIVACGNVFISLLNGGVTAKLEDGDVAIEAWEQLIGDIPVQHRLMKLWLRGLLQELEDRTECALPSENLQRVVNVFRDRSIARKAHFARLIGINEAIITDAIKSNHMSSLEEEDFAVGCVIIALELMLPPRLTKTRIEMSLSEDTFNGQLVNRMKAKDLRQWRKLFVSIPSPRFIGLESVIKGVLIILLDMKPGEAGGSTLPSELLATSVSYLESVAIE